MPKRDILIEPLIADLHGSDWTKRCDAARLLGQSRDPRAVDALLPDLRDPDWRVRRNAAQALGVLKSPRAVAPLLEALKDKTATVRERAAVALGRIKDQQAIPALIDGMVEPNGHVNQGAYQAIKKFGRKAGPALVQALTKKPSVYLVELLGESKYEAQTELFLMLAENSDPAIQRTALIALGKTGDLRAVDFLMKFLEYGDIEAQIVAVQSLAQLQATQAIPKMLALLQANSLYGPRSELYHAITEAFQTLAGIKQEVENAFPGKFPAQFGTLGGPISLPQMMGLLGDGNFQKLNQLLADAESRANHAGATMNVPSEIIQQFTAQTWKFGAMFADARDARTEQVKVLLKLLQSESALQRAAAALSLPWYTDPQAVRPLEKAMQDEDEIVRRISTWAYRVLKNMLNS
ncbi:MAG TPA: HEAT repeat domain-containing protein [Anaerolineales bacterium]|nr:HEAT repeat domain-containing protein [Anaerolineales bacterium]